MNLQQTIERLKAKDEGLGDTVKRVTQAVGLKPCDKCEERRKAWNNRFMYKRPEKK